MTKKHSSTWAASDSPPRNTTSGHSQLASSSTPMAPATAQWLPRTGPNDGARRPATISVPAPPAMETATIALAGPGNVLTWLGGARR